MTSVGVGRSVQGRFYWLLKTVRKRHSNTVKVARQQAAAYFQSEIATAMHDRKKGNVRAAAAGRTSESMVGAYLLLLLGLVIAPLALQVQSCSKSGWLLPKDIISNERGFKAESLCMPS